MNRWVGTGEMKEQSNTPKQAASRCKGELQQCITMLFFRTVGWGLQTSRDFGAKIRSRDEASIDRIISLINNRRLCIKKLLH